MLWVIKSNLIKMVLVLLAMWWQQQRKTQASCGSIEKAIVRNSIPVTKSYKNASNDLVLECDTQDTRKKLKTVVKSTSETLQLKMSMGKKPSITIVGLAQKYSKDELINQIVSQNQFVKLFSTVNNINDHIEIHDVKPMRAKPTVYQAFASVSEALRKGFSNYKDKVTIAIQTCKISRQTMQQLSRPRPLLQGLPNTWNIMLCKM